MDAALRLFSERGYHNVSMQEIADKSEFSIGSLYKFFKNKEDLYRAMVLDRAYVFRDTLMKAIERPGDAVDRMKNYIRAKGEVFAANISMVRLYLEVTSGSRFNLKAGFDEEIQGIYEDFMDRFASVFSEGIEKGLFHASDPYYMALAVEGLTNAFLFLWAEKPERHPYDKIIPFIEHILLEGILTGKARQRILGESGYKAPGS